MWDKYSLFTDGPYYKTYISFAVVPGTLLW